MADISNAAPLPPEPTEPGAPLPLPEPSEPAAALPPPEPAAPNLRRPMSRREMVLALAGGGALIATNAGTALASGRISTATAERRAQVQIDGLEREIGRLQKQLALYHDMERIGLDKLIRAILEAYDRFWPPVRAAVGLLLGAVRTIDDGLAHFELKLPTMRSATSMLGGLLIGLEAQITSAKETLNNLLKRISPIGEAVSGFLTWLADRDPLGVSSAVRDAVDRLSALVASVPPLISDLRGRLLGPLDEDWLATTAGKGLQGVLFDPLRNTLLTPLRAHLEQIDQAAAGWEEESKPLRAALDEREKIRGEIARLEQAAGHTAHLAH
ncbi:MAG TPA: hypothetical protein PLJ35_13925 [Anaerolineae bacterium]|nr:hypothetical protein [Anaerolineae bacterium]HOQ99913.1 hypothetical protein [Anaerolineae bacterium]HPL29307.1 hypothetical protein [Anaerolineae bacterium]